MANLKMDRPTLSVDRLCGRAAAAFAMAATIVGCDSDTVVTRTVPLVPVASVPAPFSISQSIVLIDDDRVCVTNSFEFRVRCVDRDGDLVGRFGRKGEGPGEFGLPHAAGPRPQRHGRRHLDDSAVGLLTQRRPGR